MRRARYGPTTLLGSLLVLLTPTTAGAASGGGGGEEGASVPWGLMTLLPETFVENLRKMMGPSRAVSGWSETQHVTHIVMAGVVFVIGIFLMLAARRRMRGDPESLLLPEKRFSAFTIFDIAVESLLGLMQQLMPRDKALYFLPLMTGFAVFILLSNLLGLVPGLLSATENLNTTFALGVVAFLAYNYWGIQKQGLWNYLKHFAGPMPVLAPLMVPIELISHIVRPVSLAVRLMGNMHGDHVVLTIFIGFNILLLPLPMMALGLLVMVVQTLVFTLLAIAYVAIATEDHDEEEHGGGGHGQESAAHA